MDFPNSDFQISSTEDEDNSRFFISMNTDPADITKFEGVSDEEIAHVTCLAIDYIHEFFSGNLQ